MKEKRKVLLLALPCAITLMIAFIIPMLYTFIKALMTDNLTYYAKFFSDPFYLKIFKNTLILALKTTVLTLVLGYPAAYFIARTKSNIKGILLIATIFPFLVSAVIRAYGWMVILGSSGLLNQILKSFGLIKDPLNIMYTETAVMIGMAQLLLPYMILAITSVIQSIDQNVENAAKSLGANTVQTFLKVTFPLSSPGVISGCILVFTMSMTSYITPQLLGGAQYLTVTTLIYNQIKTAYNLEFANAICYILVFAILIFQVVSNNVSNSVNKRLGSGKNA
ncbi:MAG: ABC transporter permease [Candidatus Metalachnospira sp.]|nr:ABC transporter permease [Candidatus Metalachnospira sp.]